ncbi:hypothetical protein GLOIN_2v1771472 [Rhizophagus clarus]|nr:hypothetical protein GLOIN_2v1771472 [Rhizophagus clarus]
MKKCPELKYFDMRSIKHQLFYIPEAKSCFESLCELRCDTSIHYSYFYGLSSFCQNIQKISIVNIEPKPNDGIAKLIEVQKNLKHFDWFDELSDEYPSEDPYKDILLALEKKADSLNYLRIYFQDSLEIKTLQKILPRFYKLKTLILDEYLRLTEEQLGQLRKQAYHDLETLNLEWNGLNVFSNIIENSGRCLKKILFRPYDTIQCDIYCFNESSLNFIRKVYENCPYIKYLSIVFPPSNEHFSEFEKLLKICQNLKSLLITIRNAGKKEANKKKFENGKTLLEILIKLAPNNLKEIRFYDDFKFSLENLEEFFERWRGREALSIFTSDSIYKRENYKALINKYISEGVIKDFIYESYKVDIYFNI